MQRIKEIIGALRVLYPNPTSTVEDTLERVIADAEDIPAHEADSSESDRALLRKIIGAVVEAIREEDARAAAKAKKDAAPEAAPAAAEGQAS
jgi:hypothetical protein